MCVFEMRMLLNLITSTFLERNWIFNFYDCSNYVKY